MLTRTLAAAAVLVGIPALGLAQSGPADPTAAALKAQLGIVKGYVVRSAEKMPDEHFAFKPSPEVRTFAGILGHIANSNYAICAMAAGEKSPATEDFEKTRTTKAPLVEALNQSFAYCEGVFDKMTAAMGAEQVKFFGGTQPKIAVLSFNTAHDFEHYGNLVTYMRTKGIVPPSSERGAQ